MKRLFIIFSIMQACVLQASTQNDTWNSLSEWRERKALMVKPDSVIFYITATDVLAHCFENCDLNGDHRITVAEAAKAKTLVLDQGGRSNLINNYDFLRFFPNLTTLSIGNTPVERINLKHQSKLKKLNLSNAFFLKEVILADGCNPEITYRLDEERPIIRHYSNNMPIDISSKDLVSNRFDVNPNHIVITIKDGDIFSQCFKECDTDNNGIVTIAEAEATTMLILEKGGRSNIIENYDFLQYFPNLITLSIGNTPVESINLVKQDKLQRLALVNALFLKEVKLAKGCKPEIIFADGENKPKVKHSK